MTRTVRDAALLLGAMAGPDARDRDSLNATGIDYLQAVEGGVSGLRVAWSPDLGHATVDPEVAALVAAAAAAFTELGCAVEEVVPPVEDPADILDTLWTTAHEAVYDDYEAVRDELDPGHVELIDRAKAYSGADVARAHQRRGVYAEAMRAFLEPYDLLLTPTLPVTAFEAGADRPARSAGESLSWTPFTYPFNLTGQPAATVPCGFASDGLPAGLQIVGRWRDDVTVLRAAAAFEAARPWAHLRPTL
jgi:aspartyl-tRNA(Asn)/glutamyl-tRNA(Gln) amidotransferase subunit A